MDTEISVGVVLDAKYLLGIDRDEYEAGKLWIKTVEDVNHNVPDNMVLPSLPFMPKMFHSIPSPGESAIVLTMNSGKAGRQRYYIGPIISQPQKIEKDYAVSANKFSAGGVGKPEPSPMMTDEANGALPNQEDIALIGRKESDLILSDDELRLRCGVRLTNGKKVVFNDDRNPAFIKMKYYPQGLDVNEEKIDSVTTVVGDRINLLSRSGDGGYRLNDREEGISDEEMKEILEKAHRVPYGDVLCDFLSFFMRVFKSHTHKEGFPPFDAGLTNLFFQQYGQGGEKLKNAILSDTVRIN